jgi:hypothetical protein
MQSQLEKAYDLIQAERLDDAVAILRPIVRTAPDNADAWWLLANAVSEPNDAYEALSNVLRLDPGHAEAKEQFNILLEEYPELAGSRSSTGGAVTDAAFGGDWESQFGEDDSGFGSPRSANQADAVDALFNDLNTTQPEMDLGDFQTLTAASFDDNFMRSSAPRSRPSAADAPGDAELDDLFSSSSASTKDDDFFGGQVSAAPARRDQDQDDGDLDALFDLEKPASASAAAVDSFEEFGTSEPSFLASTTTEPAAVNEKRSTRTGRKTRTSSAAIPLQDPFAAEAKVNRRRSPLLPLLAFLLVIGLVAAVAWFLIFRPFQPTTPSATTAATTAATTVAGGSTNIPNIPSATISSTIPDLILNAQDAFVAGAFQNPIASFAGDTFTVKTCEKPGRTLRDRIHIAMDLIGQQVARARNEIKAAELEFTDCARPSVRLFRASATIDAVTTYVDGGSTDAATYRAAWAAN